MGVEKIRPKGCDDENSLFFRVRMYPYYYMYERVFFFLCGKSLHVYTRRMHAYWVDYIILCGGMLLQDFRAHARNVCIYLYMCTWIYIYEYMRGRTLDEWMQTAKFEQRERAMLNKLIMLSGLWFNKKKKTTNIWMVLFYKYKINRRK